MYHSISDGPGPTCIAPEVFRRQMAALEASGYRVVALGEARSWMRGETELPERAVVLTFDDGFLDFATDAFPELNRRGWPATVFLPVGHLGGTNQWEPARKGSAPRRIMDWSTVKELAASGIAFGAHGVTHRDLTRLGGQELIDEVAVPGRLIEEKLAQPAHSFAAPFGRTNARVDGLVRQYYREAVGTALALAHRGSDPYAIPRIEMWYFRDGGRWRALLQGDAGNYLLVRRILRRVRGMMAAAPRPTAGASAGSSLDPRRAG
jgi:peptidoglycan/xylan/chitin deacetylase (PgdA/CDA1 family)